LAAKAVNNALRDELRISRYVNGVTAVTANGRTTKERMKAAEMYMIM
jgi:hypothetical protein